MDPYKYVNKFNKFGSEGGFKPGLERIKSLLKYFDNPEKDLSFIHVAGTNGKGSTINYIKSIYKQAGYKTGVFTSPPLINFNERIKINDKLISTSELKKIINRIEPVIKENIINNNINKPSFFEIVTLIALFYFKQKNVDIVLLEVGLGGRLDATNVIKAPLLSIITNIGFDHTHILGNTVTEIAREKGGIIKENCPVITGVKKQEAVKKLTKIAQKNNSSISFLDDEYNYKVINTSIYGQQFIIENNIEIKCKIKAPGKHQVRNAVLAVLAVEYLQDIMPVNKNNILEGLKAAFWPGRMEVINNNPLLILDGAHNVESMKGLTTFIKDEIPDKHKITFILSIFKDKNIEEMLNLINLKNREIEVIVTNNKNRRVQSPENIKKLLDKKNIINQIYYELEEAVLYKLNNFDNNEIIIITGSLYTVAEAKKVLKNYFD